MCACGCFLIGGIIAAMIYFILHALWLPLAGLIVFSALIGWFGKKAAAARKPPH